MSAYLAPSTYAVSPAEFAGDPPPLRPTSSDAAHTGDKDIRPVPRCLNPEWKNEGVPNTKFHKDYPPDAWGEEAAPNARVWKIFRDEMASSDAVMIRSWNDTLDVLLIFAGLFSAVSTAFLIESYKALQPDYAQYIANFLYAASTSSTASNCSVIPLIIAKSLGPPGSFVQPSTTQRWTNGLWFTSLVVSLTVALLCILVKQWLSLYKERTTRSASSLNAWARRHQLYYRGLNTWGLPALISLLPLLIHVALFLFFAGLVLFLRPLDDAIADTLLVILGLTLLFYLLCLVLPIWHVECPSYTPLLTQAQSLVISGLEVLRYLVRSPLFAFFSARSNSPSNLRNRTLLRLEDLLVRRRDRFTGETRAITTHRSELDGQALSTLLVSTNDADVIDAAVEAVGAIAVSSTLEVVLHEVPPATIAERTCGDLLSSSSGFAILTNARRVRTMWQLASIVQRFPAGIDTRTHEMGDLYPSLGLDGMMLQFVALGWYTFDRVRPSPHAAALRAALTDYVEDTSSDASGEPVNETSRSIPGPGLNRATCHLFLGMLFRCAYVGPDRIPCILLTLCAGNYAYADAHEQIRALRAVRCALTREFEFSTSPRSETAYPALEELDRLLSTLATGKYCSDGQVMRLVFHHLGLLSSSVCRSLPMARVPVSQVAGLIAFIRWPDFAQHCSWTALDGYMELLSFVDYASALETEPFRAYWTCAAELLRLSYTLGRPPSLRTVQQGKSELLLSVTALFNEPRRSDVFLDHTHDDVLLLFLQLLAVIGAEDDHTPAYNSSLIHLGLGLAVTLCRRQRRGVANADFVERLFAGPFLETQFRRLMPGADTRIDYRMQCAAALAGHCARLSADAVARICDELEKPSAVGDEDLEFVARIRRGMLPGGELTLECDQSCCTSWPARSKDSSIKLELTRWRLRAHSKSAFTSDSHV